MLGGLVSWPQKHSSCLSICVCICQPLCLPHLACPYVELKDYIQVLLSYLQEQNLPRPLWLEDIQLSPNGGDKNNTQKWMGVGGGGLGRGMEHGLVWRSIPLPFFNGCYKEKCGGAWPKEMFTCESEFIHAGGSLVDCNIISDWLKHSIWSFPINSNPMLSKEGSLQT